MSDRNSGVRRSEADTDQEAGMELVFRRLPERGSRQGVIRIDLMRGGMMVSNCQIIPLTIRVGVATLRVDGIGEVSTVPEYRNRGYSRRVLMAAINRMTASGTALSMLYGIPDFYPRFGYATAGPDYAVSLSLTAPAAPLPLPAGWLIRPALPADLPALQDLYTRNAAGTVGTVVRLPRQYPWTKLASLQPDALAAECRVVASPEGEVAAYAWRDRSAWHTGLMHEAYPHSLVLAEVVARDAPAADAILTACQAWAREQVQAGEGLFTAVTLAIAPEGPVASAARHRRASFEQRYVADGNFMVRTVHPERLLTSLAPELERRLCTTVPSCHGTVILETELGRVTLRASARGLSVSGGAHGGMGAEADRFDGATAVRMAQATLARLALGAFAPADLLARLEAPPVGAARALLEALFPPRHPHLSLPDRF